MSDYYVVLPGGGGSVTIAPGGRAEYYRILKSIGSVGVAVNGGMPAQRAQGEQQHVPGGIHSLRLSAVTAQTVTVSVNIGALDDGRVTQSAPVQFAQATVITDGAPIPIGIAPTLLIAAVGLGGYRYGLRFWNQGTGDVMIGGAAVTLTTGLKIPAGYTWQEEAAAASAWYGITSAAATNSVSVQELT